MSAIPNSLTDNDTVVALVLVSLALLGLALPVARLN